LNNSSVAIKRTLQLCITSDFQKNISGDLVFKLSGTRTKVTITVTNSDEVREMPYKIQSNVQKHRRKRSSSCTEPERTNALHIVTPDKYTVIKVQDHAENVDKRDSPESVISTRPLILESEKVNKVTTKGVPITRLYKIKREKAENTLLMAIRVLFDITWGSPDFTIWDEDMICKVFVSLYITKKQNVAARKEKICIVIQGPNSPLCARRATCAVVTIESKIPTSTKK